MEISKIIIFTLTFILLINYQIFAQENDNTPIEEWKEESGEFEDYELIETDTIPGLEFDLEDDEEFEEALPKKKKRKSRKSKKKYYYGEKTKRGLSRASSEVVIEFRYPKVYREPDDPYAQNIYYFNAKSKEVRSATYEEYMSKLRKGYNLILLHGAYTRYINKSISETGYFYYGLKNGRWETYDRKDVLIEKLYYDKGWLKDSEISSYGGGRVKEVIPIVNNEIHGTYYAFYENGQISKTGEYEYGERVGPWFEFYATGKRKRTVQYKKYFYEKTEAYVRSEWTPNGKKTFDYKRNGKKPPN